MAARQRNAATDEKGEDVPTPSMKLKIYRTVIKGLDKIADQFAAAASPPWTDVKINITTMDQVGTILFDVHNKIISRIVAQPKLLTAKYVVKHEGNEVTIKETLVEKTWSDIVKAAGLEYGKGENWIIMADCMLYLIVAFPLRLKELRIGQSKLMRRASDGTEEALHLSKFGLDGSHAKLLTGVSYLSQLPNLDDSDDVKRGSVAAIFGPLTALVSLVGTSPVDVEMERMRLQDPYSSLSALQYFMFGPRFKASNLETAALFGCGYIPDILEIIKFLERTTDVGTIIKMIGDMMLYAAGTEIPEQAFVPAAALVSIFKEPSEEAEKIDDANATKTLLETFDFAGWGFFRFYQEFQNMEWRLTGDFSEEQAAQIVYHSMMGTCKEDFGILAGVTNVQKWQTRAELDTALKSMTTSVKVVKFRPVQQVFYPEPIKSVSLIAETALSNEPIQWMTSRGRVSGPFWTFKRSVSTASKAGIVKLLQTLLNQVRLRIPESEKIQSKVVKWRELKGITAANDGPVKKDIILKKTRNYFVGDEL